jgi:hypothetical protein
MPKGPNSHTGGDCEPEGGVVPQQVDVTNLLSAEVSISRRVRTSEEKERVTRSGLRGTTGRPVSQSMRPSRWSVSRSGRKPASVSTGLDALPVELTAFSLVWHRVQVRRRRR